MSFACVYVLKCAENKYYVGNTRDFVRRMEEHFTLGYCQKWTAKYRPLKLHSVYRTKAISYLLEKYITLLFIARYGFENVAGYVWCSDQARNAMRNKIGSYWLQPVEQIKMSKFSLPSILSKSVSANTLSNYKSRLNKLVPYGFQSITDFQNDPHKLIKTINEMFPGNDPSPAHVPSPTCKCEQCKLRENKRYFYTAIFYALADTEYIRTPNPLYDEFQRQKQNYNSHPGYK